MHNTASIIENYTLLWDFDIQTDHLISVRRTDLIMVLKLRYNQWRYLTRKGKHKKKKKGTCKIVNLAVPADHRIKLKECEKKDKYSDIARELKKPWNMKVTIISNVTGAFGKVTKGLLNGLEDLEVGGRVGTIQITALLTTAIIMRRALGTWGDFLSLKLQWKAIIS